MPTKKTSQTKKVVKKAAATKTKPVVKKAAVKTTKKAVKKKATIKKVAKKAVKKTVKKTVKQAVKKKVNKAASKTSSTAKKKTAVKKSSRTVKRLDGSPIQHIIHPSPELASVHADTSAEVMSAEDQYDFQDQYHLPAMYRETQVTLIARDPYWLYAHWDISEQDVNRLWSDLGDELNYAKHILRVYDVSLVDFDGTNANNTFDIDVGPWEKHWYIQLWNDNSTYCVDYGVLTRDGRFIRIARSNFATTPRSTMSYRTDLIWMEVKDQYQEAPFINFRFKGRKGQTGLPGKRRLFLTDDEIRAYYRKYFYFLKQVLAGRLTQDLQSEFENYGEAGQSLEEVDIERIDVYLDEKFFDSFPVGSSDLMALKELKKRIKRRRDMGIPEGYPEDFFGSSEQFGGASEQSAGLQTGKQDRRQFFFELGTELIVYGRTEPDAKVKMDERDISLRPDGTFSMRFMLNDGNIPLNFTAQSSNGIDKRSIKTAVRRAPTQYGS